MKLPRRDFLRLATDALLVFGGLIVLRGLVRFFSFQIEPDPQYTFDLGDAAEIPPGSHHLRSDIPAVIYNNAGEFSAISLVCTHLGCTVEPNGEGGFTCPCHGSRFSRVGLVTQGPAASPLRRLQVGVEDDGNVKLHTN